MGKWDQFDDLELNYNVIFSRAQIASTLPHNLWSYLELGHHDNATEETEITC